jgi:tyrosyl-tRNA synthetase
VALARSIITDFHSAQSADKAEEEFNRRFVEKGLPEEIDEREIDVRKYRLPDLLVLTELAATKAEAKRLIEQGGVRVNGERASASSAEIDVQAGGEFLLQVGKLKYLRVRGR